MKRLIFKVPHVFCIFLAVFLLFSSKVTGNTLPSAIITLPESQNAIVVEKQSQTLYVYSRENQKINMVFSVACSTGEVSGSKKKAGDKKTPEGVYFLTDEYEDRYLTPIYGKKAFPSDYPNFYDLRMGKEGSAIWIHGTDKELKPMESNGCIALENDNILLLSNYIQLDSTPLIIVEKILKTDYNTRASREQKVVNLLEKWVNSIETGSYHQYLAFYSDGYVPDISWWENWLKLREKGARGKVPLEIQTFNVGIYSHKGIVVALFDMILSSGKEKISIGRRKLFLGESGSDLEILGDTFQERSKSHGTDDLPLIAAAQKLVNYKPGEVTAVEMVRKWLAAWSSKDMDGYAGFYADNFYSDGLGKKAWVNRKRQLARKYSYITVTAQDFEVTKKENSCEVDFFQNYESSSFSTQGTKHLKLVRIGGLWKIYRENWKKK